MLSNITVDGRTSLQTILLGQPQFRRLLASTNMDQLRQRVLTSYHLGPLSPEETQAYIEHRLHAVGWTSDPAWSGEAFAAVYAHTGGIPRRINRLCSRVLLYGALEQMHAITDAVVEATALELSQDLEGGAEGGGVPMRNGMDMDTPAVGNGAAGALQERVTALEHKVASRDQMFRRLSQMLGLES